MSRLRVLLFSLIVMIGTTVMGYTVVQAASIKLSCKSVTLEIGSTKKIKVKGTDKTVVWSTSDKKVATVSQKGKIKAKGAGTCDIIAKVGKKTLTCQVTVTASKESLPPFLPAVEPTTYLPLDYYTRDNLPEPFTSEEQLGRWLAERSYELEIKPSAEKYGFKKESELKLIKSKHTEEWEFYTFEVTLSNENKSIRIEYFTAGVFYVSILDGRDYFIPTIIECSKDGTVFYTYDGMEKAWPDEGMERFFKKFK